MTNNTHTYVEAIVELGRMMVQSGAEIWRVEDSITRMLHSYQFTKLEVYVTTTLIVVSVKSKEGTNLTQSARIKESSNNLRTVERLNQLSRTICATNPPVEEIQESIERIVNEKPALEYPWGYCFAALAFAIFFGGTVIDGLIAGGIGLIVYWIESKIELQKLNKLMYTIGINFGCGSLALLLTRVGIGDNADKIIIGTVMLFIPGLALVNGTKDMFNRDIISGFFRIVEAILIALAIATGIGLAILLWGGF